MPAVKYLLLNGTWVTARVGGLPLVWDQLAGEGLSGAGLRRLRELPVGGVRCSILRLPDIQGDMSHRS